MSNTLFTGVGGHQTRISRSDDWLTPPDILGDLGPFDLDPCASCVQAHGEAKWTTARNMVCKCRDGLVYPWGGLFKESPRIWLNPPYDDSIGEWMRRLANHGNGIALVFARTDTIWFQEQAFARAHAIYFFRGRVRFFTPDGKSGKYTGGAPSALVAYGRSNRISLAKLRRPGRAIFLKQHDED